MTDKKKADAATAANDATQTASLSPDDVQRMIAEALAEQAKANAAAYDAFAAKMPDTILGVVKDVKLFEDSIAAEVAEAMDRADFRVPALEAATALIAGIDWNEKIDAALASRATRAAEEAEASEKTARDAEAARQRKVTSDANAAARKAADAEREAAKRKGIAADQARRQYATLMIDPIASPLTLDTAKTIELRFGDGESFLPGLEIDIDPGQIGQDSGRPVLNVHVTIPREAVPFRAREAVLLVEGDGKPLALWRSELMEVAVGGGSLTEYPTGSLAFRRLSPLLIPSATDAA